MGETQYFVYILASKRGTLYVGVTNNLKRRVEEHRSGAIPGFAKRYGTHRLVYFESSNDVRAVLEREKQIKKWRRSKKLELIRQMNPMFEDLLP